MTRIRPRPGRSLPAPPTGAPLAVRSPTHRCESAVDRGPWLAGGFLSATLATLRPLAAIPLDAISASLHRPLRGTPPHRLGSPSTGAYPCGRPVKWAVAAEPAEGWGVE